MSVMASLSDVKYGGEDCRSSGAIALGALERERSGRVGSEGTEQC